MADELETENLKMISRSFLTDQAIEFIPQLSREALAAVFFVCFSDIYAQPALCGSLNQQLAELTVKSIPSVL